MSTIGIVGVGAIGGSVAGALGNVGHEVTLCVRTRFDQLRIELEGHTQTCTHPVLAEPALAEPVDWLLVCTKAHQTDGARTWFSRMVNDGTIVVVLQNGVEHESRVRGLIPPNATVLPCVVRLPATAIEPGHIVQNRHGRLQIPAGPIGSKFAELFEGQNAVQVDQVKDFTSAAWDKLVRNAVSGICAVTRQPMGVLTDVHAREFVIGLIEEIKAVGEAEGAVFSNNLIEEFFAGYGGSTGELWTSIAKDARDERPMEWDARNAVIGRLAKRHGIATPLNDALTTMLQLMETN